MVLETKRYPKDKRLRWRLVYQSDFTVDSGSEGNQSERSGSFIRDGYLHIIARVSKCWAFFSPGIILDDFRAQVDIEMSLESGETAVCGLMFSMNGDDVVHMSAEISRSKFYCLYLEGKGGYRRILDWTKSELIKPGDKSNLLMLERIGEKVKLGINNYIVAKTAVSGLTRGTVGLTVRTDAGDAYAEAMFKNFLLYSVYRKFS
jgi:hypothetical protein